MPRSGPPPRSSGPELIWDGKYDERGHRRAPVLLQPAPTLSLIEQYGSVMPEGAGTAWHNRLILGDNLLALQALLLGFRGQVQLIYIDPPFDVGSDFRLSVSEPGPGGAVRRALAYRDRWGRGPQSYLHVMYERLMLLRDLLAESGALFLHCDWRSCAALRLMLDEVFGRERFVNEIVWHYYNKYSGGKHCLPRAHDTILLYGKSARFAVNPVRLPRDAPVRQLRRQAVNGVLKNMKGPDGKVLYRVVTDKKADDVWALPQLQPASPHWTGFGTQKHHDLLARIIALASRPGDLVADLFCGSGTTLIAAQALGRRWIGCDVGLPALHVTRRRIWSLRETADVPASALDVFDLGEAERRRYLAGFPRPSAFVAHVLTALGAKPVSGTKSYDGTLRDVRVRVMRGACEPTAAQVVGWARAVRASARRPFACLAWCYSPGTWEALAREGLAHAVLPVLLPRDWLAPHAAGDVTFLTLPRLTVRWAASSTGVKKPEIELTGWSVTSFAPKGSPPLARRRSVSEVDAWAVQGDWQPGAPFVPQALAHRSHRQPRMLLRLPVETVGDLALIKAWDAFGQEGCAVLQRLPARPGGRRRRQARR